MVSAEINKPRSGLIIAGLVPGAAAGDGPPTVGPFPPICLNLPSRKTPDQSFRSALRASPVKIWVELPEFLS